MLEYNDSLIERRLCLPIFNRATFGRCREVITNLLKHEHITLDVILASSLIMEEYGNGASHILKTFEEEKRVTFTRMDVGRLTSTNEGVTSFVARLLDALGSHLAHHRYDGGIVVGDRFETLAAAIAFRLAEIPITHIQGGEVTENIDEPIRHAVTKLSDYHMTCTELAREYVKQLGEKPNRVFLTGCPTLDTIREHMIRRWRPKENYILAIFHPHTDTQEEAVFQTKSVLDAVIDFCRENYRRRIKVYWYWPNPDPGRERVIETLETAMSEHPELIERVINEDTIDFLRRLAGARMIVGNSSSTIRESSMLQVPAICVGDRQGVRERGENVITTSVSRTEIKDAMEKQYGAIYHVLSMYGAKDMMPASKIAAIMAQLDYSQKPALTYPQWAQFRDHHFGEGRFQRYRRRRHAPGSRSAKVKGLRSRAERESLKREPEGAREGDGGSSSSA